MKTPTAKKLPSGSWFVRVTVDGETIPITRPTEKEALAEAMALKARMKEAKKQPKRISLRKAAEAYIEARSSVLSPSTICGYKTIVKTRFQTIMDQDISSLTVQRCQRAVDAEAREVSAKTLKNAWAFVASVIGDITGERPAVRLKPVVKKERPFLQPEQIDTFLDAIRDRSIEIPALLALSSLRRSEILDLQWKDVDLNAQIIHVRGAAVYDENWKLVHKAENKNRASRRDVPMIAPLHAALSKIPQSEGYVVTLNPSYIYEGINRVCEENGLPKVGIHGLRHSFASLAYHLGIPEKIAMKIGGWANAATMHEIYTHLSDADIRKHSTAFTEFFTKKSNPTE